MTGDDETGKWSCKVTKFISAERWTRQNGRLDRNQRGRVGGLIGTSVFCLFSALGSCRTAHFYLALLKNNFPKIKCSAALPPSPLTPVQIKITFS